MAFKLVHAKYDRESERAYVELRDEDDDGGDRDIGSHHLLVSHHGEAVEAADRAGYCAKSAPHSEARRSFYLSFGIAGTAFRPPTSQDMVPPRPRVATFGTSAERSSSNCGSPSSPLLMRGGDGLWINVERGAVHLSALIVRKIEASGQVSDLVLRMTGPAGGSGSLRTPPPRLAGAVHERS